MEVFGGGPTASIRLLLTGGASMVYDGVRSLLSAVADFDLVGEATEAADVIAALHRLRPAVLVVDCAGDECATEVVREAVSLDTGVVMLVDRIDDRSLLRAACDGVSGYLLKADATGSLIGAVRAAAGGEAWLSPSVARRLLDFCRIAAGPGLETAALIPAPAVENPVVDPAHALSDRERGVLRLLAQGYSNAEIAEQLTLGRSTVKTHVSRILAKLELRDRVQLAAFAHQNDLA
jgi:DNA-binding NarL/FixJ family response regulator